MRAEGIVGDLGRSLVKRQILCVDEPVCVGTTDGGVGLGWCGTAAGRGEEAWACAAKVGDDVVDDGVIGDEAQGAESDWTRGRSQGLDFEHTPGQFRPGQSVCAGGRGILAWGLVGSGVAVGGELFASGAADA